MYSYEDRVRAVKLHIKLGKRTAATIRQLGYPKKNTLKSWHRVFERCRDLSMRYPRSKPKYSDEQKKLAVDHYLDHGRCMTVTIKALGCPGRGSLTTWIDDLHPDATRRLVGK
jgi:putative transposase